MGTQGQDGPESCTPKNEENSNVVVLTKEWQDNSGWKMCWMEGLPGREALLISQNPFLSDERATAPMFVPAGGEPIRMCRYVS